MSEKKYFWFKMEDDFFKKKEIKKLRSIAGGDTFVIIYLKIILLSLKTGGKLYFEGIDDSFASEIALEIDEDKNNVFITLEYLLRHSAVLQYDENEYHVNVSNLIGSETSTAIRVRKHRENKKMLPCNDNCYNETPMKQNDNGEIELEKEIKKEKELKLKQEKEDSFNIFWEIYNKKKNKEKSFQIWCKIDPELYQVIYNHVKIYRKTKEGKDFPYHPNNYLKDKHWNDEIETEETIEDKKEKERIAREKAQEERLAPHIRV